MIWLALFGSSVHPMAKKERHLKPQFFDWWDQCKMSGFPKQDWGPKGNGDSPDSPTVSAIGLQFITLIFALRPPPTPLLLTLNSECSKMTPTLATAFFAVHSGFLLLLLCFISQHSLICSLYFQKSIKFLTCWRLPLCEVFSFLLFCHVNVILGRRGAKVLFSLLSYITSQYID